MDSGSNNIILRVLKIIVYLVEDHFCTVKQSETSNEFIKCRFLNLLIMECCSYYIFNNYIELFKTGSAYFMAIYLYIHN